MGAVPHGGALVLMGEGGGFEKNRSVGGGAPTPPPPSHYGKP